MGDKYNFSVDKLKGIAAHVAGWELENTEFPENPYK